MDTPGNLAYGVEQSKKGKGFIARLISLNTEEVDTLAFEPVSGILFLLTKNKAPKREDLSDQLEILDYGKPTPEFVIAMRDQGEDGCLTRTSVMVEELGVGVGTDSKVTLTRKAVRILERSAVTHIQMINRREDGHYNYLARLKNGFEFKLLVASTRDPMKMRECGAKGYTISIAGVMLDLFSGYRGQAGAKGTAANNFALLIDIYGVGTRFIDLDAAEERALTGAA